VSINFGKAVNAWYAYKYRCYFALLPDDWGEVKLDVMYRVVLAKFTQHPDLRQLLMNTGNPS